MATLKFVALMLLALLAVSMLETTQVIAKDTQYQLQRRGSAMGDVRRGAARRSTTSHACSSVRSAAGLACVCPQVSMATKLCALATTTGRPRKEDPSALRSQSR
ncbi:hypothetical protein BVC80_285g107 [Macleaya cordata]|uniref:Uncharacterized protein n=1 Tax=Macleaya cordata TaxID=56857 RepID=A0A200QSF0_MACCD|nr:hypothetical protein BVC80_285g107 [Macleaya cordata]